MSDQPNSSILDRLNEVIDPERSHFFGPVAEERIKIAENELGVIFPSSYRLFLSLYGAAQVPLIVIYGLPDQNVVDNFKPAFFEVVPITKTDREHLKSNTSDYKKVIAFAEDSGGVFFYFDTSMIDEDGESPVFIQGPSFHWQFYATNFIECLRKTNTERNAYIDAKH